jgi:predicted transcriptional regulator
MIRKMREKKRLVERASKIIAAYSARSELPPGECEALILAIHVMRYFGLPEEVSCVEMD